MQPFLPADERPLAGEVTGTPLAALTAPSAEVGVLVEEGGVPAAAVPQGLPERLNASLQGEQPFVQGGAGGGGGKR